MSEDQGNAVDSDGRTVLTGISSRAFEHPADRTALTALRSVPGFDQVLKAASGLLRERQYRLVYLSSAVRVDERQFSGLQRIMDEVAVTARHAAAARALRLQRPVPRSDHPRRRPAVHRHEQRAVRPDRRRGAAVRARPRGSGTRCPGTRSTNRC